MVEVTDLDPFVWGKATRGPQPYLWAKCDPFDAAEPVLHETLETEEGFRHRIIWRDNTGLTCESNASELHPNTLAKIYKKARATAEEIEFYSSGAIIH